MMSKSVLSLLDEAFGRGQKSRDGINYSVSCPSCDKQRSKKKLSIRLDDYRYHCWVCGLKGKNIWAYVEKNIPGFSHKLRGLNLTKRRNIFEKEEVEEQEQLDLPPGLSPVLRASKDPDKVSVKKYLTKKRGLSSKDIFRWRVLSCKTGKYRRHAVIPSFDKEGKLNYFVARAVDDTTIKYRNARVSKIDVIFNALHGKDGEDGIAQSFFEYLRIPYTHSGVISSVLTASWGFHTSAQHTNARCSTRCFSRDTTR